MAGWAALNRQIVDCNACPRLRAHCIETAKKKRRAFLHWDYWGRPVPNFGDPQARLLIVGLAPAAHGANRTGRMFTGDRSGDWLYRAMHRAGFANQAEAIHRDDGLTLRDCAITAVCHCAPPDNKPTPQEIENCRGFLERTVDLLPARVYLALGKLAWDNVVRLALDRGWIGPPRPKFGHAATASLGAAGWLLGSYHPSQQNTFTGKLTEPMLDDVFRLARELLDRPPKA